MTPRRPHPGEHILDLLAGKWVAQAVSTAATLGISDALQSAPLDLDALAAATDTDPSSLERLMAVLLGEGLYVVDEQGRYSATEAGRLLGAGEGSLKGLAAFVGSAAQWTPWAALPECVRTGRSAYESTHGQTLYDRLADHPEDARCYDEGVDRFTGDIARALGARPELAEIETVIDVGGGLGTLLAELLRRWPNLRGTLVDLPHVLERAAPRFRAPELAGRVTLTPGDFFETVPTGGDLYVLKHVLHNWSDADALRILHRCREAMGEDDPLWVVEGIVHASEGRSLPRLMDLEMMVLFGRGRARTKQQLRALLGEAGFQMKRTTHAIDRFARLVIARAR